jgi:hypothetical protein
MADRDSRTGRLDRLPLSLRERGWGEGEHLLKLKIFDEAESHEEAVR